MKSNFLVIPFLLIIFTILLYVIVVIRWHYQFDRDVVVCDTM
jgi:hypothetical protein